MDNLIKDYKITKQNIIKKLKIKENFWKEKDTFLKEYKPDNRIDQKIYNQITSVSSNLNNINISNLMNRINPITDLAGNFSNKIKNTLYSHMQIENSKENSEINNLNINSNDEKEEKQFNNEAGITDKNTDLKKLKKLNSLGKIIENKNTTNPLGDLNDFNFDNNTNKNPYEDSSQVLNLMKKNDTKDLDKTKQILFGLSDLMSNFSTKVLQHQEMTERSK